MVKIGVTGGIGSGKSIVCEVLRLHGIPVYDADFEAKRLNDTSPVIRKKLIEAFGPKLYKNNFIDRKKLADLIFNNKENLLFTNSIIHSELAKHFKAWTETRANHPIVAIDAAVLFEAGFQKHVDKTVTVLSPLDTRIRRVAKRDNLTQEEIKSRIDSQMSDEEKIKLSDFVIHNDNNHSIIKQVSEILLNI